MKLFRHKRTNNPYILLTEATFLNDFTGDPLSTYYSNGDKFVIYQSLHDNAVYAKAKDKFYSKFEEISREDFQDYFPTAI